jgi:hypothetical protein
MSQAKTTTDHKTIQKWVEMRKGTPSKVKNSGEGGILRIDFGEPEDSLEPMDWDEFFTVFEDRKLAFLYQEKSEDGGVSRFNKFVSRTTH